MEVLDISAGEQIEKCPNHGSVWFWSCCHCCVGHAGRCHGNGVDTSLQEEVRHNSDVQTCVTSVLASPWHVHHTTTSLRSRF